MHYPDPTLSFPMTNLHKDKPRDYHAVRLEIPAKRKCRRKLHVMLCSHGAGGVSLPGFEELDGDVNKIRVSKAGLAWLASAAEARLVSSLALCHYQENLQDLGVCIFAAAVSLQSWRMLQKQTICTIRTAPRVRERQREHSVARGFLTRCNRPVQHVQASFGLGPGPKSREITTENQSSWAPESRSRKA